MHRHNPLTFTRFGLCTKEHHAYTGEGRGEGGGAGVSAASCGSSPHPPFGHLLPAGAKGTVIALATTGRVGGAGVYAEVDPSCPQFSGPSEVKLDALR